MKPVVKKTQLDYEKIKEKLEQINLHKLVNEAKKKLEDFRKVNGSSCIFSQN